MNATTAVPAGHRTAEIPAEGVSDDVLRRIDALWTAVEPEAMPEVPLADARRSVGS